MTQQGQSSEDSQQDHPALSDHDIDEDYIDPPQRRAELRRADPDKDDDTPSLDRSKASAGHTAPSERSHGAPPPDTRAPTDGAGADLSRYYDRSGHGLGNTAIDHKIDADAPREHDGRAQTRTGFDPREAPNTKRWRRLNKLNDGWRSKERDQQNKAADRLRWLSAIGTELDLTPYQSERAEALIDSVNVAHFGSYKTEVVIMAAVSLAANADGRWVRDEDTYRSLLIDLGARLRDVRRCRTLLRQKSDLL